jgi:hypothetical protein
VLKMGFGALALTLLGWLFITSLRNTNSAPYRIDPAGFSSWTLITGDGSEPGVVGLQAASMVTGDLFRQVFQRTMHSLAAPSRAAVPLVLQREYAESLQGVMSVDNILQTARLVGLHEARFEPVCLGALERTEAGRTHELYFVLLSSAAFDEFRQRLAPAFPEHAGTESFDPGAVRPVLPIASTDRDLSSWWPLEIDEERDCQAGIE